MAAPPAKYLQQRNLTKTFLQQSRYQIPLRVKSPRYRKSNCKVRSGLEIATAKEGNLTNFFGFATKKFMPVAKL